MYIFSNRSTSVRKKASLSFRSRKEKYMIHSVNLSKEPPTYVQKKYDFSNRVNSKLPANLINLSKKPPAYLIRRKLIN